MRNAHLLGILPALALAAPAPAGAEEAPEASREAGERLVLYGEGGGQYRLRSNFMSEIPLSPPLDPAAPGATDTLGQRFWVSQWFRLGLEVGLRDRLRLVGEMDAFDGLVVGDFTEGVEAAERPRDHASAFPGVQARALFLEWTPSWGKVQAGMTPVHWGLGILQNDGAHEPPFGDYRYGDVALRLAATVAPLGEGSPFHLGAAGDLVYQDQLADLRDGERAFRGTVAAVYREGERRAGLYAVYRSQRSDVERRGVGSTDALDAITVDAFARWDLADPTGGKMVFEIEAAYTHLELDVRGPFVPAGPGRDELVAAGRVGRETDRTDVYLELGWASEGGLDRAVMHPDHRVGLVLFPEVIAWQTARSATLLEQDVYAGPVPAGTPLVPTQGGVAAAVYLFPTVTWRIRDWLRARFGAVWAHSVTDVVDPYRLAATGERANHRGGDPDNRDLGLELDAQVHARAEIARGIVLTGGLEGGWFLPGHAFDDAAGDTMAPVGLLRVRAGLTF